MTEITQRKEVLYKGAREKTIINEYFPNSITMFRAIDERDNNPFNGYKSYFGKNPNAWPSPGFSGFESCDGDHGRKMLEDGMKFGVYDRSKLVDIGRQVSEFKSKTMSKKRKIVRDVRGFRTDIGEFIIGDPLCCRRYESIPAPKPTIELCVDVGVSAYVKIEEIQMAATEIIKVLVKLDKSGFKTALSCTDITMTYGEEILAPCLKLKDTRERLNINRMVYPILEPAFLRGVLFTWSCTLPADIEYDLGPGLGIPLYHMVPKRYYAEAARTAIGRDVVPISIQGLLEETKGARNSERASKIYDLTIEAVKTARPGLVI